MHNKSTLLIFKAEIETTFFIKHDTELRDDYNYKAQPKIGLILEIIVCYLICMHQRAALKMWGIEVPLKQACV